MPQKTIDDVFDEAKKQKIEPKDDAEREHTARNIGRMVKALVARDLWDMNEYFHLIYSDDEMVRKAVEMLSKPAE